MTENIRKTEQLVHSFEKKLKECVEKINRIDLQLSDQIEWYNNHEIL